MLDFQKSKEISKFGYLKSWKKSEKMEWLRKWNETKYLGKVNICSWKAIKIQPTKAMFLDGWVGGWMGVKAILRIASSNQKLSDEWSNPLSERDVASTNLNFCFSQENSPLGQNVNNWNGLFGLGFLLIIFIIVTGRVSLLFRFVVVSWRNIISGFNLARSRQPFTVFRSAKKVFDL